MSSLSINPSLAEAEARYRAALAEADDQCRDEPGVIPMGRPIQFGRFVRELLELYHPTLRSKSTLRGMQHCIGVLSEFGVKSTADLTVSLVARVVASRDPKLSPNTVLGLLRYLQALCNFAARSGYLRVSPFAIRPLRSWVRPSRPMGVKRHNAREEIRRLLDLLRQDVCERLGWAQWRARRLLAMVATAAYAGPRLGELTHLQVDDIHLAERWIHIVDRPTHRTKSRKDRVLPICADLAVILEEWLAHRMACPCDFKRIATPWLFPNLRVATPWSGGPKGHDPLGRLKAAAKRAGIETITWQMLRRSCCTHMIGHGAGGAMAQRILGHASIQTTEEFYHQTDLPNMLRAVEGFTY